MPQVGTCWTEWQAAADLQNLFPYMSCSGADEERMPDTLSPM